MFEVFKNTISNEVLDEFTEYFISHPEKHYASYVNNEGVTVSHRCDIHQSSTLYKHIKDIASRHFSQFQVYGGYQRQSHPHSLHIDENSNGKEKYLNYTLVIPILTDHRIKTYVFKEQFRDNLDLRERTAKLRKLMSMGAASKLKKSNISETEDLEHTYEKADKDYLANYLDLDGIFQYERNSYVLFNSNQIHCSSNWRKYPEYTTKDILQIHITDLNSSNNFFK